MQEGTDFIGTVIMRARQAGEIADLTAWRNTYVVCSEAYESTLDVAIAAGAVADRIGYAFASGYQAALSALFSAQGPSSMLVTEAGGGHPRAMASTLVPSGDGFVMTGEKRFATLGTFAETLYVLAKESEVGTVPSLRVVAVPSDREGISITEMPATPFCPEIPHANVRFEDVRVDPSEVLEGDGYAEYVKPFRTVEDLHVFGAVLGHALGVAVRHAFDAVDVERLLALVASVRGLSSLERDAPGTALALDGTLTLLQETLSSMPDALRACDEVAYSRWERDVGIFRVAETARTQRLEKARIALGMRQ